MFGWFTARPSKPRELTFDAIADIIERYGALLEKYPTAYVDERSLPAPKEDVKSALKAAWKTAGNSQIRNAIEIGWMSLHRFQPNVGPKSIDADTNSLDMLNRFVELSKLTRQEMDRDFEELRAFTSK
jgi:hypothetical protein